MAKNHNILSKKRANKWDTFNPADLNPLGRRLLSLIHREGMGPREFSAKAHGDKGLGNLSAQLERLKRGAVSEKTGEEKSLMGDQLAKYARAARVSLVWLITGEGTEVDGPYGDALTEKMLKYPEALQRAARALIALGECSHTQAEFAMDKCQEQWPSQFLTPQEWMERLRIALKDAGWGSGVRPSPMRLLKAAQIEDDE